MRIRTDEQHETLLGKATVRLITCLRQSSETERDRTRMIHLYMR